MVGPLTKTININILYTLLSRNNSTSCHFYRDHLLKKSIINSSQRGYWIISRLFATYDGYPDGSNTTQTDSNLRLSGTNRAVNASHSIAYLWVFASILIPETGWPTYWMFTLPSWLLELNIKFLKLHTN
jgi:hypothetical protein